MKDSNPLDDVTTRDAMRETTCRLPGWTPGRPVRLADGGWWSLPRFDACLMLTTPGLQASLARAVDLADEQGGQEKHLALTFYHAFLAGMAVNLLQVNYDLTDDAWRSLLRYNSMAEMLTMTQTVSLLISDTSRVWVPFYLTAGPDGVDNLMLN